MKKPSYLYDPEQCCCERGVKVNCPRNKNCEACTEYHHTVSREAYTACERKALAECGTLEFEEE